MPPKIQHAQAFVVTNTANIASFLDLKDRTAFRRVSKNAKEGVQHAVLSLFPTLWEHGLFFQNLLKVKVAPTSSPSNYAETMDSNLEAADSSFHHMLRILKDSNPTAPLPPPRVVMDIIERTRQLNDYYIREILHTISEYVASTYDGARQADQLKASMCKILLKQGELDTTQNIIGTISNASNKALALIDLIKVQPTQENLDKARSVIATIHNRYPRALALVELAKANLDQRSIHEAHEIIATITNIEAKAGLQIELVKAQPTQENIQEARNLIAIIHDDPDTKAHLQIMLVKSHPTHENIQEAHNLIAKINNPHSRSRYQIELVEALLTQEKINEARSVIVTINLPYYKAEAQVKLIKAQPTSENIQEAYNFIATIQEPELKSLVQNELIETGHVPENLAKALQIIAPIHQTDEIPLKGKLAQKAMLQGNFKKSRQIIARIQNLSEKAQAQIACFEILFTMPSAIKLISSAAPVIRAGPAASGLSVFPIPIISKAPPSQPALSK